MGKPLTEATKKKLSDLNKGKLFSLETRQKISESKKGIPRSEETKQKLRERSIGHVHTTEQKRKIGLASLGRHHTLETRLKMSMLHKGEKGSNWKGGLTLVHKLARRSVHFKLWRSTVFERDNWTCQKCKQRGGKLHPHHILNFSAYPLLRYAIDNGITLCDVCHRKFHQIFGKENNNQNQLVIFLR